MTDVQPGTPEQAVAALRRDHVVVVPTDTVYGLAARFGAAGVERLFVLKGRSTDKAFAVLVGSHAQAAELADLGPAAARLAECFWPGPLTIVTRRAGGVDLDLGGDRSTIGLRFPRSELIVELTHAVGPLVTTSANRSGEPCLESFDDIAATFGRPTGPDMGPTVEAAIDGGILSGEPSTVVDCTVEPVVILRPGPLDPDLVRAVARGLA